MQETKKSSFCFRSQYTIFFSRRTSITGQSIPAAIRRLLTGITVFKRLLKTFISVCIAVISEWVSHSVSDRVSEQALDPTRHVIGHWSMAMANDNRTKNRSNTGSKYCQSTLSSVN